MQGPNNLCRLDWPNDSSSLIRLALHVECHFRSPLFKSVGDLMVPTNGHCPLFENEKQLSGISTKQQHSESFLTAENPCVLRGDTSNSCWEQDPKHT